MPSNNAWNGKWSGDKAFYAIVKNLGKTKKATAKGITLLKKAYRTYSFGDGWVAGIHITEVNAKEAAQKRRKSKGFYGYEWMVDSILREDEVITYHG